MSKASSSTSLKPILLYDHLPGILAGYPAALFTVIGISAYFIGQAPEHAHYRHMIFWIGWTIMLLWYVAFRFNLPKSKFMLIFGLLGTFVGIPIVLELTGYIKPFTIMGGWLGKLAPEANAGAWIAMAIVFFVIWLGNFIYSRTHLRVRIDESGLTVNRLGGKGERFELIGLKTENEPLDYLELFLAGVGSLKLKTRMNKPIFEMKRVIGLYRTPWCPFFKSKLARIEEMLSYQGKVLSVEAHDMADLAEQMDSEGMDDEGASGNDNGSHDEFDDASTNESDARDGDIS
jgi:hypothetical protein